LSAVPERGNFAADVEVTEHTGIPVVSTDSTTDWKVNAPLWTPATSRKRHALHVEANALHVEAHALNVVDNAYGRKVTPPQVTPQGGGIYFATS
jgi:hypothetical protein